jgi:uncharacterized protein YjbI with pentapeptide repeats
MTRSELFELIQVLSAVIAVVGGIIAAYHFLRIKSRHERMAMVGDAFRSVIESLASDNEVKRLAGAVLLRRFFNPFTELGIAGTPYADECIKVIAALLREPGLPVNVQKLLADSLAYAPDLKNADFQRTDLHDAYLGDRIRQGINVSGADFFEANLNRASLVGINARRAVFFRAQLAQAQLRRADLRDADFRDADLQEARFDEADLLGTRFDGASLAGARFKLAKNLPRAIAEKLDPNFIYPA